jgi:hypothetical protein
MNRLRSLKARLIAIVLILALATYIALSTSAKALPDDPVTFSLPDAYGRVVSSQDYAGVPVFLEFGACW